MLNSDDRLAAIREAEEQARRAGVQGVPFFIMNDEFALSGAQEPKVFLEAFGRAGAEPPTGREGGVCEMGAGVEPSC